MSDRPIAVVAGAGGALGPALLNGLDLAGYTTVAIARNPASTGNANWISADLSDEANAEELYQGILNDYGTPSVLIYNAHRFLIKPFAEISSESFQDVWRTDVLGAFLAAHHLLPKMIENSGGTVIFSGATASIRGSANFAAFASAKFALRGLAQSLAREYGPQGIHVAHAIIDGIIDGGHAQDLYDIPADNCIDPTALTQTYLDIIGQTRSVWTHEIDIRPYNSTF
jgi:NAD(P)-dependent dehydrogenase (short-subunit alcohol dehydrogenase family)